MAVALAALLLAGCTVEEASPHALESLYDYGKPGAAIQAYAEVVYYPACRNEALTVDGVKWSPYQVLNTQDLPTDPLSEAPSPSPVSGLDVVAEPVGAVVPPGPGDDVGTLVIYENDLAYWESDSGELRTWLTNRDIMYSWAC